MLPIIQGGVHLAVEGGCGGTTIGLQLAREALRIDKHVVWVCQEMPDGDRFGQIFSEISPAAVSKMHLIAVGEQTEQGVQSASSLLRALNNIALVVVDDWTDKTGRPKSNIQKAMLSLFEHTKSKNVPLLAISSAYEDANGSGWKARKLKLDDTWFLHRSQVNPMRRELHTTDGMLEYILGDDGFIPHK
jgi:hypothetical protein